MDLNVGVLIMSSRLMLIM